MARYEECPDCGMLLGKPGAQHNCSKRIVIEKLEERISYLEKRQDAHLRLIRKLTIDSVTPREAKELRARIAALISEVGTLRALLREYEED